jgi:heme oxygenase
MSRVTRTLSHCNRDVLRQRTAGLHTAAEQVWRADRGFPDLGAYRAFLSALLSAHQRLGLAAAEARGDAADMAEERARITALKDDLGDAAPPQAGPAAALPARSIVPDRAWGIGYALNGSALGAAMMLKAGMPGDWPISYLTSLSAYARSGRLATFFRRLNAAPLDLDIASEGGCDVFRLLAQGPTPEAGAHRPLSTPA